MSKAVPIQQVKEHEARKEAQGVIIASQIAALKAEAAVNEARYTYTSLEPNEDKESLEEAEACINAALGVVGQIKRMVNSIRDLTDLTDLTELTGSDFEILTRITSDVNKVAVQISAFSLHASHTRAPLFAIDEVRKKAAEVAAAGIDLDKKVEALMEVGEEWAD